MESQLEPTVFYYNWNELFYLFQYQQIVSFIV